MESVLVFSEYLPIQPKFSFKTTFENYCIAFNNCFIAFSNYFLTFYLNLDYSCYLDFCHWTLGFRIKLFHNYHKFAFEKKAHEEIRSTLSILQLFLNYSLRGKCLYSELFWSVFPCIQTEYGEILCIGHFLCSDFLIAMMQPFSFWLYVFTWFRYFIENVKNICSLGIVVKCPF